MTIDEAIKEVRFNMSTIGLNNKAAKRVVEARDMAINALEKQIPKKIKVVEDIRLDGVKEYFAVCPNCDKGTRFCVGIGNYNKYSLKNWIGNCYCSNCGQKLDWSDEE